jgi:hypothetical protein
MDGQSLRHSLATLVLAASVLQYSSAASPAQIQMKTDARRPRRVVARLAHQAPPEPSTPTLVPYPEPGEGLLSTRIAAVRPTADVGPRYTIAISLAPGILAVPKIERKYLATFKLRSLWPEHRQKTPKGKPFLKPSRHGTPQNNDHVCKCD